jgi:hypothetical protein
MRDGCREQRNLWIKDLLMDIDSSPFSTVRILFPNKKREMANITEAEEIERKCKQEDQNIGSVVDVGS